MKPMTKLLVAPFALLACAYVGFCFYLWFAQRSYIYHPTGRIAGVPSFVLQRGDADIVVSMNAADRRNAVLYFGGNAEDVSGSIAQLSAVFPDADIYAMHYRGYGGSTGSISESALVADGVALFDRIAKSHRAVTIVGRSLGSGVAVQVAADRPVERLVLVTPYYSIADLAAQHFSFFPVGLLLRDRYESWRYAEKLKVPVTLIVAGNDHVIPAESSAKLARSFPDGQARVVVVPGADHNDVSGFPEYAAALVDQPN